ncbi:MAG: DUF58 domain-containing protein [Phycisphaerales bacterium]|nr:MAG: DUF58 domain-containing protein [Phycisphaerales bacterium]
MKRRYHLHIPGFIYVALVLVIAVTAMNSQNNLLFWIFGVLFSGLLISGIFSGWMMLGLRVKRLDPEHGTVGGALVVRYAVTNRSRFFPAFNVHIEERPARGRTSWNNALRPGGAWIMHIGPRETVHGEATFPAVRRGEARFEKLRIWTTFPFGIVKKSITFTQLQHTFIHPRLYELRRRVLDTVVPHSDVGTRISSRPGAGDDYFGLREYRPGDSLRHVAWKRTATRDELICIERSRPSPPRIRVVLNLSKATADLCGDELAFEQARDLEEQAISLAASFVHLADLAGYAVGLTVSGGDLPAIPVRGSRRHRSRIMAGLASIDLDRARKSTGTLPVSDADRSAMVIIHPHAIDPKLGRVDGWHLSAVQLAALVVAEIGRDITVGAPAATGVIASDRAAQPKAEVAA